MSSRRTLQIQQLELRRLLDEVAGDAILEEQFRARLDGIERQLSEAPEWDPSDDLASLPRAAIFLRGESVRGTEGIRSGLAGELLSQYERMFSEQALQDERDLAKDKGFSRRPKGSPYPGLLFVGTPRGSFGLEFVPQPTRDPETRAVHVKALATVTGALSSLSRGGLSAADDAISQVHPSVLRPMKMFMKALANHGAELRLVFQDRTSDYLGTEQVSAAVAMLEREVIEREDTVKGVFRGATLQSGYFDLLAEGDELITGSISRDLSEEQLLRLSALTNQPCVALVRKTTVRPVSGGESVSYMLLDARPRGPAD